MKRVPLRSTMLNKDYRRAPLTEPSRHLVKPNDQVRRVKARSRKQSDLHVYNEERLLIHRMNIPLLCTILQGTTDDEIKVLMRTELKSGSYRAWRKRVRDFGDRRAHYK